eukprot:g4064.t1
MCRQALLPFFHQAQTTVTGKVARACDAVSPFVGGPFAEMNRTLASCVNIVTDRDGSSVPHCSRAAEVALEIKGFAASRTPPALEGKAEYAAGEKTGSAGASKGTKKGKADGVTYNKVHRAYG